MARVGRRVFGVVLIVLGAGFMITSVALLIAIASELAKGHELGEDGVGYLISVVVIGGLALLIVRAGWRRARRSPTAEK